MLKVRSLSIVTALLVASAAVASALGPEGGPDDHHLCYKAKSGDPKFVAVEGVSLADAFDGATTAKVAKSALICNAADNAGAGIIDSVTHLAAYKIKSATKHAPRLNLLVSDSFGLVTVDTKKADLLLVPGPIAIGAAPTPPFLSFNVDHYKCYSVKVSKGSSFSAQQISLTDQFSVTAKLFDVKKPKHLCVPVSVSGSTINNSGGHLMCYQAKAARNEAAHVPVTGIRVGNELNQIEAVSTKKEAEVCLPAVLNPACGDNKVNQASEECDGTSDSACPGQCSTNCGCWRPHAFVLSPSDSRIELLGINVFGPGVDRGFSFSGLSGTITMNTGNQIKPGQYELSVPTVTLPPLDLDILGIGALATACVFLQEDPNLPGSGIAGLGTVNCLGAGLVDDFPSANFFVHQDHCTDGVSSCDSGTAFSSQCESALGPGKTHSNSGACVPAAPTDATCTATDDLTGSTAKLEGVGDLHPAVCNSPTYTRMGPSGDYRAGDTVLVLNAVLEVRTLGDPCTTPPGPDAIAVRGPVTTGTATSTIMDVFPGLPGTGKVQALVLTGMPFTCVDQPFPQHGDPIASTIGTSFVIAGSALDLVIQGFGAADINAGIVLVGE